MIQREADGDYLGSGKVPNTIRIADAPNQANCTYPEHNPPTHAHYEQGIYQHTCPKCGHKKTFIINPPTF